MAFWDRNPKQEAPTVEVQPIVSPSGAVTLRGSTIDLVAMSAQEAKIAIRECRAFKKELALQKREINAVMADIRAERRLSVGTRGSMMRGGGGFGTFMRTLDRMSRDSTRASYAKQLARYEDQKSAIDAKILGFDRSIHQLEQLTAFYELEESSLPSLESTDHMFVCGFCGVDRGTDTRFCSQCGAPID